MNLPATTLEPEARPCDCAALDDLLEYLNDNLPLLDPGRFEPGFAAQAARFHPRGGEVEAEIGPFTLRSAARRIVSAANPSLTVAWRRALRARTRSGREVEAELLLRLQRTDRAVVAMDRLLRVLHMLNHLGCAGADEDLWVHTSQRHLLGVESGHGAFFEDLLRRCGLGPARIVLVASLPGPAPDDVARAASALAGYRTRGFRIALDLPHAATSLASLATTITAVAPDYLRVDRSDVAPLRAAGLARAVLARQRGLGLASLQPGDLLELPTLPAFLP